MLPGLHCPPHTQDGMIARRLRPGAITPARITLLQRDREPLPGRPFAITVRERFPSGVHSESENYRVSVLTSGFRHAVFAAKKSVFSTSARHTEYPLEIGGYAGLFHNSSVPAVIIWTVIFRT